METISFSYVLSGNDSHIAIPATLWLANILMSLRDRKISTEHVRNATFDVSPPQAEQSAQKKAQPLGWATSTKKCRGVGVDCSLDGRDTPRTIRNHFYQNFT